MSKKFFLLPFFSVPLLVAAQDSAKVATLSEVTVTATRSTQNVLTTPRSVTVITADDIQKTPYQNLADLLQRYEGIFVPGTFQNPGSLQTLYLRGADNKQTLIMIDGIKLSDASTPDNGLDLNEVSLNSIERIEIVRGSQGTLYGGSAVGGVINIITKKSATTGVTGVVKLNAGTFGEGTFVSNAQAGITYTGASGFYARGEVLNTISNGFNNSISPTTNEKDNFRKTDYVAKAGYNKNRWDAYIGYRKTDQKADIDDGAFTDDENNVLKFNRNLYTYGLSRVFNNNFSAKFFGGYTNTERKNFDDSSIVSLSPRLYDGTIVDAVYTDKNLTNEIQLNYNKNRFSLVGGAGYVNDKMNTNSSTAIYSYNYFSKTNYDTLGIKMSTAFVYSRAAYNIPFSNPGYGLNLSGGLRYSNNSRFGNFVSYEFTPNLQLGKKVSVYGAYSTGYNAPSLYQLFAPEKDFTSGVSRGFSSLKPEESQSIELGIKAIAFNKIGLRLSVYNNQVKNYIDYVYLWNGSKPINSLTYSDYTGDTYLNTGKQTNKGVEAGIDITFNEQWQLHTNISYNKGELSYNATYIDAAKTKGNHVQVYSNGAFLSAANTTSDLIRRPNTITNTSLVFKPTKQLQITADARTVGKRSDVFYDFNLGPYGALGRNNTDDFALFNLSALYQINTRLSVSANCFNIFNTSYTELSGFQTRGRSVFGTIQFTF